VIAATADHIISLDVLPPRDRPCIEDNDPSARSSCDPLADLCDAVDRVDLPDATLSGICQALRICCPLRARAATCPAMMPVPALDG
jgi:hypothetical protein